MKNEVEGEGEEANVGQKGKRVTKMWKYCRKREGRESGKAGEISHWVNN